MNTHDHPEPTVESPRPDHVTGTLFAEVRIIETADQPAADR